MTFYYSKKSRLKISVCNNLKNLFKIKRYTDLPSWLQEIRVGDDFIKSKAASKIYKFAKEVNITQEKLMEIYLIECEYEEKKHIALEQFPHLPQIMRSEISEFRSIKMDKMQNALTKSQFDIYSKLFKKNKRRH